MLPGLSKLRQLPWSQHACELNLRHHVAQHTKQNNQAPNTATTEVGGIPLGCTYHSLSLVRNCCPQAKLQTQHITAVRPQIHSCHNVFQAATNGCSRHVAAVVLLVFRCDTLLVPGLGCSLGALKSWNGLGAESRARPWALKGTSCPNNGSPTLPRRASLQMTGGDSTWSFMARHRCQGPSADATLVAPLSRNGLPHGGAAKRDGAVLKVARRPKRAYPELAQTLCVRGTLERLSCRSCARAGPHLLCAPRPGSMGEALVEHFMQSRDLRPARYPVRPITGCRAWTRSRRSCLTPCWP